MDKKNCVKKVGIVVFLYGYFDLSQWINYRIVNTRRLIVIIYIYDCGNDHQPHNNEKYELESKGKKAETEQGSI